MKTKVSKNRSSKSISKPTLERAVLDLQKLPSKSQQTTSLKTAIALMHDSITQALNKGYSYAEVSTLLNQQGIQIAPSSLRIYLTAARRQRKTSPDHLTQISQPSEPIAEAEISFSSALDYVLTKNAELYQRLA
jgi:hypothetical protein